MIVEYVSRSGKVQSVFIGRNEYVKVARTIKQNGGKVLRAYLA